MRRGLCAAGALCASAVVAIAAADAAYVNFESGQVRPLALSPDGTRLFAVNTADGRLEIFAVAGDGALTHSESVTVGLDPVAVAAPSNGQVWVVNHLSDSVSVVDFASSPARVVRTLLTCDEPRDVVFAGAPLRAFVTAARRGQNCPLAANATTAATPRAVVQVFDAANPGAGLGGTPVANLALFGDTPRALATDGDTVWAAVFQSGNRTTTVPEGLVCNGGAAAPPCNVSGFAYPGGLPAPNANAGGAPQPEVGLIVRFNPANAHWEDELGRDWSNAVRFDLPDLDVFSIDADALTQTGSWASVGTVLFNMAVNPASGRVYVSNTEAHNEVRFEGFGSALGNTTVNGHLHEARVTVLDGATATPHRLNPHIDYDQVPSPPGVKNASLATPTGMAVTADGSTLYVAAFGSAAVGVLDTAELESGAYVPSPADHIVVSGGGPSGLVLSEAVDRLYVLTRFDNSISVIDTVTRGEVDHLPVGYDPEPAAVVDGRPFLYDAFFSSSNGEASCSSCHIFGDFDSLAWDLGDPDGAVLNNPNPLRPGLAGDPDFHPMKGPMTTQTLRGMANHGPMHWRGDRTGGNDPGGSSFDEDAAFKKFNVAFPGLLGRDAQIDSADMQAFTDFILTVTLPPNPIRNLDNSLTADQLAGRNFFFNSNPSDGIGTCNFCHVLNPAQGFFGGDGFSVIEPQAFKIPHLRNLYQKVGMFGMAHTGNALVGFNPGDNGHKGAQVRGFGFLHDGSVDTLFRFFDAIGFNQSGGNSGGFANDTQRRQMEAFMLAFDSNVAPIVGQQITIDASNAATVGARINLLLARAAAGECDVIVKGNFQGEARGAVRLPNGNFRGDRAADPETPEATVRARSATPGQEITYTCVPVGSGVRMGIDRDEDGFLDRDEIDAGSDPGDASSVPGGTPIPTATPTAMSTPTATPASTQVCGAGPPLDAALLKISRNDLPAGDEKLTLKGEMALSAQLPPIDPVANGVAFGMLDRDTGAVLLVRVLPPGLSPGGGAPGWKVNGSGTVWTFQDNGGQVAGGVVRAVIKDRSSRTPGLFTVRIKGKDADFRIPTERVSVVVVLGGVAQEAQGQCAARAFGGSAEAPPRCALSASGGTLRCK